MYDEDEQIGEEKVEEYDSLGNATTVVVQTKRKSMTNAAI